MGVSWPLLTLDLNLSNPDHLADTLTETQEKVDRVEHVHLLRLNATQLSMAGLIRAELQSKNM